MSLVPMMSRIGELEYEYIRKLVYERSRINLGTEKKDLVTTRVSKRLRALRLPGFEQYCQYLSSPEGKDEITLLVDAISTNHTFFFREKQHFEFMEEDIFPKWLKESSTSDQFRIWSAACSSGEEMYSAAITLAESKVQKWEITASDISTRILEKAQNGVFSYDRVKTIPHPILKKHFQEGQGKWEGFFRVKGLLREQCRYHHLNLLQETYPFRGGFDLVFCRNVMIYFDTETQQELCDKLYDHTKPGGYLFIGHSESLMGVKHKFKLVGPAVYQRAK